MASLVRPLKRLTLYAMQKPLDLTFLRIFQLTFTFIVTVSKKPDPRPYK